MIYRFLSAQQPIPPKKLGFRNKNWIFSRFGGAWMCGALDMEMNAPKIRVNPKAKFYLTELGYKKFAKAIISSAKIYKQILKVISRKNPKRSQICYKDKYQVAIIEN